MTADEAKVLFAYSQKMTDKEKKLLRSHNWPIGTWPNKLQKLIREQYDTNGRVVTETVGPDSTKR